MDRLKRFLATGVSCFIDLTSLDEAPAYEAYLPFATPDGRRITYLREPIPDHDVPAGRETMTRVLRMIEDALAEGHIVYLHCRAGVGRSAMVVGCWLADHRPGQVDVIETLQALWRQSARSRVWSEVPETEDQVDYVRSWRGGAHPPATRPGGATPGMRERAAGMLLGLAAGDALGASVGAAAAPGNWTQHTSLALCLADSLVESRGFDAHDQMQRYLRWQSEGYLAAIAGQQQASPDVARALATYRWRGQPMAGSHDPRDRGTASLSRSVIAALIEPDAAVAVALASESSRTTHQSPLVVDACRYLAAMLCGVLQGDSQALTALPYAPGPGFWDARPLKPEIATLEASHARRAARRGCPAASGCDPRARARAQYVAGSEFRGCGACRDPGPRTRVHLRRPRRALAGGLHGLRGIPVEMLDTLRRREMLDQQLTRILVRRARTLAIVTAASRDS
jgi:hypothetical protein